MNGRTCSWKGRPIAARAAGPPGRGRDDDYRTLVGCSADGIILFRGSALATRGGEAGYLRRHLPDAGRVAASLAAVGAPAGKRAKINLDGGPRGPKGC